MRVLSAASALLTCFVVSVRGFSEFVEIDPINVKDINLENLVVDYGFLAPKIPRSGTAPTLGHVTAGSLANNVGTKIVGGIGAELGRYPFIVGLIYSFSPFSQGCGGSLIAPNLVLTAAHCIEDFLPVAATIGCIDTSDLNTTGCELIAINGFAIFDGYDPETNSGDYALLRISKDSQNKPVALTGPNFDISTGQDLTVIGWGATASEGSESINLLEVEIDEVDRSFCNSQYLFGFGVPAAAGLTVIDDSMICATRPAKDSCQGDSGGPLFLRCDETDQNISDIQIGVVSFGIGCASEGFPGVYADVRFDEGFEFILSIADFLNLTLTVVDDFADFCLVGGTKAPTGPSAPATSPPTFPDASAWTCDSSFYNSRDGCDCVCGEALDPDCLDSTQEIFGCATSEFDTTIYSCNSDGQCVIETTPLSKIAKIFISIGVIVLLGGLVFIGMILRLYVVARRNVTTATQQPSLEIEPKPSNLTKDGLLVEPTFSL